MPNNDNNGLSLEALLAAARGTQEEAADTQPAAAPAAAGSTASASAQAASSPASTESAEPAVDPSAAVQEEALEQAEERAKAAAPAFDLAAALGYGSRESEPAASAREPEEKFDLAAALGYKSQEVREREAAEAAAAEAAAQARAVQERAIRNAEHEARVAAANEGRVARSAQLVQAAVRQADQAKREERVDQPVKHEQRTEPTVKHEELSEQPIKREEAVSAERKVASVRAADVPQVRSRSFEESTKSVSPEERYAAQKSTAQSATASDGGTIESYQPTKRDRSAQARAARPLRKSEVSEVAQAIAADAARTEYVELAVEVKAESEAEKRKEGAATAAAEKKQLAEKEFIAEKPIAEKSAAEARFTKENEQHAAPLGESVVISKEAVPPMSEPVLVAEIPTASQSQPKPASSAVAPAPMGQPIPIIPAATPAKPATMPHKVPVRTTEEIIKPAQEPIKLGVISPETARHETAAKKKVQSAERKIVKKVRRFRTLGMFLIVLALAALAGAIFLFVAGNAQASESIEATATEICEQAGRTITYRYKAADSNGTLCPTTEVATFSAGDVLEQSVITMNTPDFETAAHTLANFKKQFQDNSYVDGRVDGSTVIFTLHMSNERIMKVTYTALLMKNTTGCEVII